MKQAFWDDGKNVDILEDLINISNSAGLSSINM